MYPLPRHHTPIITTIATTTTPLLHLHLPYRTLPPPSTALTAKQSTQKAQKNKFLYTYLPKLPYLTLTCPERYPHVWYLSVHAKPPAERERKRERVRDAHPPPPIFPHSLTHLKTNPPLILTDARTDRQDNPPLWCVACLLSERVIPATWSLSPCLPEIYFISLFLILSFLIAITEESCCIRYCTVLCRLLWGLNWIELSLIESNWVRVSEWEGIGNNNNNKYIR